MSHVIEDGTGLSTATAYADDTALTAYATARGITLTGTADDLITQAMDYLESQNFIGSKLTKEQSLMWPRSGAFLDNFFIDTDELPALLIEAQHELSIALDGGVNPLANVPRETASEKVGDIAVTYSPSAFAVTYLQAAETKLRKITRANLNVVRV